jgi:hypothetical protein
MGERDGDYVEELRQLQLQRSGGGGGVGALQRGGQSGMSLLSLSHI